MRRAPVHFPAVILGAVVLFLFLFVFILENGLGEPMAGGAAPRQLVYFDPSAIWSGAYWGVLSSAFVHIGYDVWQMVTQFLIALTGLWLFGRRVEAALGHNVAVAVIFFGALVGGAANLAAGSSTGYGASGIVFGFIGVIVALRRRHYLFAEMFVIRENLRFLMLWTIVAVVSGSHQLTVYSNYGHLACWAMGFFGAEAFLKPRPRPSAFVALTAMATLVVLSFFWLPWNLHWRVWRFQTEALAGRAQGGLAALEPRLADAPPDLLNKVAWILATCTSDGGRNGDRAVELAHAACAAVGWSDPSVIDTLAASYAEAGRWQEAVAIQRLAVRTATLLDAPAEVVDTLTDNLATIENGRPVRE